MHRGPTRDAREVWEGLHREHPTLSPKWFYDAQGSALFDQITHQPEYYPTRCESEILQKSGSDIADWLGPSALVAELGAGNGEKGVILLRHLERPTVYVPIDISPASLDKAVNYTHAAMPGLRVEALCADFFDGVSWPQDLPAALRCVLFFGSTIGNMEPHEAEAWMARLRRSLNPGDRFLVGVDLKKDVALLNAAYNDAAGVTARFNRNALAHLSRALGTTIDMNSFRHHAAYNADRGRMEMYLEATSGQTIRLDDGTIRFNHGDRIHTENSYKYTVDEFSEMATAAGFKTDQVWLDAHGWFSLHGLRVGD